MKDLFARLPNYTEVTMCWIGTTLGQGLRMDTQNAAKLIAIIAEQEEFEATPEEKLKLRSLALKIAHRYPDR